MNAATQKHMISIDKIRADFPILSQSMRDKPLAFLDNGASSQKPQVVIDAISEYYETYNTNIHRGVYQLSQQATDMYEKARIKVQQFLNAPSDKEIIFLRGTTEGINLVASSYGRKYIQKGDEIIISAMEHHSNIVPWQMLCEQTGAILKVIPITDEGEIELDTFKAMLNERTKMVGLVHVSNSLGTINPVEEVIRLAHEHDVPVILDGAQAVPHQRVDVQALDVDFYVFSGHKLFAPTGIGILYGKEKWLEEMPPYMGGGDMIRSVTFEKTTYNELPHKFEAGTPDISGPIGLAKAIDYIENIGYDWIGQYEKELLEYGTQLINDIDGVHIIGNAKKKASVISFIMDNVHPHDVGQFLDYEGIAVRTGHHCTQPIMDRYKIPATTRASMAFYNTKEELDRLAAGIIKIKNMFR